MKILFVHHGAIPTFAYGGTERVIWGLGKALAQLGHEVSYLVHSGSSCPFGRVITLAPGADWRRLVPSDTDVVHLQFIDRSEFDFDKPTLATQHGNSEVGATLPRNTVFISANHAARHGAVCAVLNGLDWEEYAPFEAAERAPHFHFLGKAAWRVKNVQGAIDIALHAQVPLTVMGGHRLNIKRGFRFTASRRISFLGMVGGEEKFSVMRRSRGLIFPVRWHEPFGLAVIESLYFGCPVFSTPYGALPELVPPDCGVLSADGSVLAQAVGQSRFNPATCHAFVRERFSAARMAHDYLQVYEKVMAGEPLNPQAPCMIQPAHPLAWRSPQ
jgi:glycosyltransferase involved in cell wall biosynthesis